MEAAALGDQDRIVSTGQRPVMPANWIDQPLSPKDERIVSANPSTDAAIIQTSVVDVIEQSESSDAGGDLSIVPPLNAFASQEPTLAFGGYGNHTGWDGYSPYANAEGLHVFYNDNPSLMFHSGYGFNPEMAYGQYSPVAAPLPSIMVDGQLYSPQQIPFSPSFYPHPTPNVASSLPVSPSDPMTSESNNENLFYGPGSGYLVHFGPFGGGNISSNSASSPLASAVSYPQPMGILGPYEHHAEQISQQQMPPQGFGTASTASVGHYPHGSYQGTNFGSASISYSGSNDRIRFSSDKGRRRERDRDSIYISNDSHGFDRNRGPRASKLKSKVAAEQSSLSGNGKVDSSRTGIPRNLYNRLDFVTDYEHAIFFVIKSFSEDNVHKSIKYNVWASTPLGNRKLDAAYHEAKAMKARCPVFLLFSVNASGQFCGVAQMVGPVDFEKNADYWQQDRWSGQFPVQWHIIKDVPNSRFRHILLENNDNKPVTHSRDSQEVKLEQGIEMLKIFKDHDACASILDDFDFYDEREKGFKEKKTRQQASQSTDASDTAADNSIDQMADTFGQALQLEESGKEIAASKMHTDLKTDGSFSLGNDHCNKTSGNFSQVSKLEAELGGGCQN